MNDYRFGNYIFDLRRKAGLSQTEVAAAVGVTDKAVSKWETGKAKPTTDTLRKLSALFHISIEEMLDSREKDPPKEITKIIHTALSMGLTIQSMHQEDLHDFGEYPSGKDFTPDELEEFLIPSMGLDYVRVLFDYQGHTIRVTESYWGFSVSADGSKKCVDIAERLVFEVTEE